MTDIKKVSAALREMADRIDLNENSPFGGCFCIIPPDDGTIQSALILDSTQSPPQFWGTIQAKATQALNDLEFKERQKLGFQGR